MSSEFLTIAPSEVSVDQVGASDIAQQTNVPQGSQEIIIDGTPLQIPAGNYRTEYLEDGTVQVIVYQEPGQQTLGKLIKVISTQNSHLSITMIMSRN